MGPSPPRKARATDAVFLATSLYGKPPAPAKPIAIHPPNSHGDYRIRTLPDGSVVVVGSANLARGSLKTCTLRPQGASGHRHAPRCARFIEDATWSTGWGHRAI
jgi:hypothetical protein